MHVLFVHQNFPGQYRHLAQRLAAEPGHRVVALCAHQRPLPPGIEAVRYSPAPQFATGLHPWLETTETRVIMGEAAARAALALKRTGFSPDVICAHPGWGEALFLKDVWPDAPLLCYLEFFFHSGNSFAAFDPEFPERGFEADCALRMKNSFALHSLAAQNLTLRPGDPVITFVSRSLEPARGFPVFMRALPLIQRACPTARVIIVGAETPSYSPELPEGQSYKQRSLDEVGGQLDWSRVHFVGTLPHDSLLRLFQVSAAHVYLSYPYVLS